MTMLSRRHLVTTAAALPALAVAAAMALPATAAPDPIFAAIDKFDALNPEYERICELEPDTVGADGRNIMREPEYVNWEAAQSVIFDKWCDAKDAVLATVPTTAAGAAAFMKLFRRESLRFLVDDDDAIFDSVVVYLERAAAQS